MSEEDAYTMWPGCIVDKTGAHHRWHYHRKYQCSSPLTVFFGINKNVTLHDLDVIVIKYATAHHGISNDTEINYDEPLWTLFGLNKEKKIMLYHINTYVQPFLKALPLDSEEYANTKNLRRDWLCLSPGLFSVSPGLFVRFFSVSPGLFARFFLNSAVQMKPTISLKSTTSSSVSFPTYRCL